MARKNSKNTSPEQVEDAAEPVATVEVGGEQEQGREQVADNSPRIEELRAERDQLAARLGEANAELRTLTGSPTPNTVESPVAVCREVFEDMPGAPRKDVVAACVARGVNKATAQTQYQVNRKQQLGRV